MHVVAVSRRKNVEFILKGKAAEGSFKLYSDHASALRLDGVELFNPGGPANQYPISSACFDFVCRPGAENVLKDGSCMLYRPKEKNERLFVQRRKFDFFTVREACS